MLPLLECLNVNVDGEEFLNVSLLEIFVHRCSELSTVSLMVEQAHFFLKNSTKGMCYPVLTLYQAAKYTVQKHAKESSFIAAVHGCRDAEEAGVILAVQALLL